jgi:hypothetical protein
LGEFGGVRVAALEVGDVGEVYPYDDAVTRVHLRGEGQGFLAERPRSIERALGDLDVGEISKGAWQPAVEFVLASERKRLGQESAGPRPVA